MICRIVFVYQLLKILFQKDFIFSFAPYARNLAKEFGSITFSVKSKFYGVIAYMRLHSYLRIRASTPGILLRHGSFMILG
jgi:hypothetical protein